MSAPSGTQAHVIARGRPLIDWRSSILLFALTVAETAAVWLVVQLFLFGHGPGGNGMPPLPLFLLIFVATFAPRLFYALGLWEERFALAMTVTIAASLLVVIKLAAFSSEPWFESGWLRQMLRSFIFRHSTADVPVWIIIVIAGYAWLRGQFRAEPSLDAAYTMLRIGTAVVLGTILLIALTRTSSIQRPASGGVVVFFAAALAAAALAHLWLETGRARVALGPRWVLTLLSPIGIVVVLTLLVSAIFSPHTLGTIIWFLGPLLWALSIIFRLLILLIALIAFILVSPILLLLSGHTLHINPIMPAATPIARNPQAAHHASHVVTVPDPIRYLIAAVVLLVIVSLVTRFVLRRRQRVNVASDEERESMSGVEDLLTSLGSLRRKRRPRGLPDPLAALRGDPRWAGTLAVREIYRQFLVWSAEHDLPRHTGTTPTEHGIKVSGEPPGETATDEIATLTTEYNRARYGARPLSHEDADRARTAWRQFKRQVK